MILLSSYVHAFLHLMSKSALTLADASNWKLEIEFAVVKTKETNFEKL